MFIWPWGRESINKKSIEEKKYYHRVTIYFSKNVEQFSTEVKEPNQDWPQQYIELTDWFYYSTKREVFSFKHKDGITLFRKKDVKKIKVEIITKKGE